MRVKAVDRDCIPYSLEDTFLPWLKRTVDIILPYLPLPPSSFQEYAITDIPPPLFDIRFIDQDGEGSKAKTQLEVEADALEPGWEWATLKRNSRATSGDWWQDVREIDLALEAKTESVYEGECLIPTVRRLWHHLSGMRRDRSVLCDRRHLRKRWIRFSN